MPSSQPLRQSVRVMFGIETFAQHDAVVAHLHAEARHAVAHLAQRQAEALSGRRAIEPVSFQSANQDVPFDLIEMGHQVVGQRSWGIRGGAGLRRGLRGWGRGLGGLIAALRGRCCDGVGRQAEVIGLDGAAAPQGHGTVQQVFKFPYVAREGVSLQCGQR